MKLFRFRTLLLLACSFLSIPFIKAKAQTKDPLENAATTSGMPNLIRYGGRVADWATRRQSTPTVNITFSLYAERDSPSTLWTETQSVSPDEQGHYSVLLGFLHNGGIAPELFTSDGAKWLGISVDGEAEAPRGLLFSVPYAYKAVDAATLGGHPPSEFVLYSQVADIVDQQLAAQRQSSGESASPTAVSPFYVRSPSVRTLDSGTGLTYIDNNDSQVLQIQQLGTGYGLNTLSTGGTTIFGLNAGPTVGGIGVLGQTQATSGVGVRGDALDASSPGIGIWGSTAGAGTGVLGESDATSGLTYGIRGKAVSPDGLGASGAELSATGATTGVRGEVHSPNGAAGVFDAFGGGQIFSGRANGIETIGIDSGGNVATSGSITSGGTVAAKSFAGSGASLTNVNASTLNGMSATQLLNSGATIAAASVNALSGNGTTVSALNTGGVAGGIGVLGQTQAERGVGVRGDALDNGSPGIGIWGSTAGAGTGVLGESDATSGLTYGIRGKALSPDGLGAVGAELSTTGATTGVRGEVHSPDGVAGVFDASFGGHIFSGRANGRETIGIDSVGNLATSGSITAQSFTGSGANLKNVNAATLNGMSASQLLAINQIGAGLTQKNGFLTLDTNFTDARYVLSSGANITAASVNALSRSGTTVYGLNASTTAGGIGILGQTQASSGVGMRGDALDKNSAGIGIWGSTAGAGTGVLGESNATSGQSYGIRGKAVSPDGLGAVGAELSATGATTGVRGEVHSPNGVAGVFDAFSGGHIFSGRANGRETVGIDSAGNLATSGSITSAGSITAQSFTGSGANLTNVNAATLNGMSASQLLSTSEIGAGLTQKNGFLTLDTQYTDSRYVPSSGANVVAESLIVSDPAGGVGGIIRDDLDTVHSGIDQGRTNYHFRLSRATPDAAGQKPDFLITPYDYGMGVEYAGVLEFWTNQFSVHKANGPGGAQFWVGDDFDLGGLWVTATGNNRQDPGRVIIAADRFDHTSHGTFYIAVRNPNDKVVFTNGAVGAEAPIAQIRNVTDATHSLSAVESVRNGIDAALMADQKNGAVRIGALSAHPVQLVTGDTTTGLTLFPDGNISIGNQQDAAVLSVGSNGGLQVSSSGALTIGGGTPIAKHISVANSVSFGTISGNSCTVQSVEVTGASDGDTVALGVENALGSVSGVMWFGWVSAPDTVSIRVCNMTVNDAVVPDGTIRSDVWKH